MLQEYKDSMKNVNKILVLKTIIMKRVCQFYCLFIIDDDCAEIVS